MRARRARRCVSGLPPPRGARRLAHVLLGSRARRSTSACCASCCSPALSWVAVQSRAVWWAQKPAVLRHLPPGWRALEGVLPIDATLAGYAQRLVVIAGGCATLGLLSRVSAPVAALSGAVLAGHPELLRQDRALRPRAHVVLPGGRALAVRRCALARPLVAARGRRAGARGRRLRTRCRCACAGCCSARSICFQGFGRSGKTAICG